MPRKTSLALIFIFCAFSGVFSQARGAIFNEEAYNSLPRVASFSAGSYEGLPSAVSLRQYAPLPGDQTMYGTCVGWAAAYAARTISESIALNRLNQSETTENAFSPNFVYRSIRPDDPWGLYGAQIHSALDLMRDTGAVKMLEIEHTLGYPFISLSNFKNARNYPIGDYLTLFSSDDRQKQSLIVRIVKKSLAEGKPVIIGMNTPDSFSDAKDVWQPWENPDYFYYGHALCVTGYDDSKYGGAFEVLNSWGRKWGNGGYIWIPYQVFVDFTTEAYEIIENIAFISEMTVFEGFALVEFSGEKAEAAELTVTQEGFLRTAEAVAPGSSYRFTVGASQSAYVYTFSVSQNHDSGDFFSPVLLFPQSGISALMSYSNSMVTLPGEDSFFNAGSYTGTEYLITLYSKQALDIQGIMRRFESTSGTVSKRLAEAAGDNLTTSLSYNDTSFIAMPDDPRIIAALIVAIEHTRQ